MKTLVGKTLKNRYRVDEFLGRGGMADVYKVWDKTRADALAMKVLREDLAQDKIFLRRFEREAQTLAKLQHRSIVRFYGLEQDDLLVFLLMEYIEGTSLREEIFRAKKPFINQRVLEVLRPVCAAMHYAHCMGIVHCDLKPGNILINQHGELLVTDFGIARMIDASTATMVGLGTPAYMAPELVKGQDPTPQTDIYALGVILYEMLAGGERPFTGERAETTGSTAEKIRWEQMKLAPKPLTDYNPEISPAMQEIVIHCLAKKHDQRYEDMQVVYEEAEIALKHKSGSIEKAEPKAELVKEQAHEFHRVEKEEVNEDLQIPKQSVKRVKRNSLSRKKKEVPLFTYLGTQEGNIYDFDLYTKKVVVSAEGEVFITDFQGGNILQSFKRLKNCGQVFFHSKDEYIIFQRLNDVEVLDIKDGKGIRKLSGGLEKSGLSKFSVNQKSEYCAGINNEGDIIVWDLNSGKNIKQYKNYNDPTSSVIISSAKSVIKISETNYIHSLSLPDLKILNRIEIGDLSLFSKEKKQLACSTSEKLIAIWKNGLTVSLKTYQSYKLIAGDYFSGYIGDVAFTPDETKLIIIDTEGILSFLNIQDLSIEYQMNTDIQDIQKLMLSDDGQYMVTLCKGERLDYWKLNWEEVRN